MHAPLPSRTDSPTPYRGRLAPSPTGYLHLGHARTFWTAFERAQSRGGVLVLRNEDIDQSRCKSDFVAAMFEDLRWFGFDWQEGPDAGGAFGPYTQSERTALYLKAFERLKAGGFLYPCWCSRNDVLRAASAPHAGEDEPLYPGTCRGKGLFDPSDKGPPCWRFLAPRGRKIVFSDGRCGPQCFVAGQDFGDFVVWRRDGSPSYQLAVVVDDAAMRITEVVRGEDLLRSAARQILLYEALEYEAPEFYHCPLMLDEQGARLAKRRDSLSLRRLRSQGARPHEIRAAWFDSRGWRPTPGHSISQQDH